MCILSSSAGLMRGFNGANSVAVPTTQGSKYGFCVVLPIPGIDNAFKHHEMR